MTSPIRSTRPDKRMAQQAIRFLLRGPLREPTLALLRGGVRTLPGLRPVTALAFYAGEALAEGSRELTGRLRSGSVINLLPADYMHRHIYFYGEYEKSTTRFLRSIARRGWTFLDVGANVGYFSLLAHDLGGSNSSIHAFEPNPRLLRLLELSVASTSTVRVVASACGDHSGVAHLHLSPDDGNTGLSTLRPDVLNGSPEQIEVSVITLDDYCAEHMLSPDVIKIDVEGHEIAVLNGARKLMSERAPHYVICELAPERSSAGPLLGIMSDHGYSAWSLRPDGGLRTFQENGLQNVVFVRS